MTGKNQVEQEQWDEWGGGRSLMSESDGEH